MMRRLASGVLPIYALLYLAFLYLPILFLPLFSFNDSKILAFPMSGFTTKWYAALGHETQLLNALGNSIIVGLFSTVFATAIGSLTARAITRYRFPLRRSSQALQMAPLVMPEVIVAVSLLIMFLSLGLSLSLFTVALAHVLVTIPYSISIMTSAFEQFDDSLEEAAIDLGEGEWGALRRVTLPVVAPGIVSSLLVGFTVSFDEFIMAFFLTGTEPTLPVYIWSQVRFPAKLPIVLALGTLLILASLALLLAAEYFRRRSLRLSAVQEGVPIA
ncbi:ABC transporter permease [Albidovulum sp.]|uniref:ABC transporter permease n=1 Tax=Albidovulum sp. TaxID=1872424 RepID=UPI003527B206